MCYNSAKAALWLGGSRIKLSVHVHPNARRDEIEGFHDGALEVRIAAAPVKGKANKALVEYLAHLLGISKGNITIVKGETSRRKVIEIEGTSQEDLLERLSAKNRSQGA